MIRKQVYNSSTLQTTTDYIDGFVYITQGTGSPLISYFPMPEGRVLNTSSTGVTLVKEFIVTDQQGNARVSFRDGGSGTPVVYQENSYYGFGLVLPNSPVGTIATSNKQLYNGGSEWQNDYSNLPDYYQTYYRNYDAALARWVGVDPMAEASCSISVYHYSGNNPIMYNDPLGDKIDPDKVLKNAYDSGMPSHTEAAVEADVEEMNAANAEIQAAFDQQQQEDNISEWNGIFDKSNSGVWVDYSGNIHGTGSLSSPVSHIDLNGSTPQFDNGTRDDNIEAGNGNGFALYKHQDGSVGYSNNSRESYLAVQTIRANGEDHWDYSYANQGGYPVGLHQFIAMAVGESGDGLNAAEIKGIASSMINRINQAGTSLYDPNWIKKTSYGGNIYSNYKVLKVTDPKKDYPQIMGMSMTAIKNSRNQGIQAAISAYMNWGIDYSNPNGYADTGLYYWNRTSGLPNSTYGDGTGYVKTLTAGGAVTTTFYRPW